MKKQFSIIENIVSYFEKFGSDQHATQKIKTRTGKKPAKT